VGNPQSNVLPDVAVSQFRRMFAIFWILVTLAFASAIQLLANSESVVEWPTISLAEIATNRFLKPTCIAGSDDGSGRLFVGEQGGKIWIVKNGKVESAPFLDLSAKVITTGPEQGLLGLAFPPGFASKQYFYVYYTASPRDPLRPKLSYVVVSRFYVTFDPNLASARAEDVILKTGKDEDFHNGGHLVFGPDGFLYIGIGDGGPQGDEKNRAQDLTTRFGKLLRIDVESGAKPYAIPSSNPFVGNTNVLPEIWAYGLRNPWRFSFDRLTGDLYIGDVGQWAYEEVDFQPANSRGGENYGWRIKEGPADYEIPPGFTNFTALTPPIISYDHQMMGGDGGQGSVTGGFVYRGPKPGRMQGMYLYGDFAGHWLWGLKNINGTWTNSVLFFPWGGHPIFAMSTFGEDHEGRLYLADYYGGKIFELTDSGQVWKPQFSPNTGRLPTDKLTITCATPNAEIHYTTDGGDPNINAPRVPPDGVITVRNGAFVAARAYRNDLLPSDEATGEFFYQTGPPIFSPEISWSSPGVLSNTPVTLSSVTPGAKLYYTTNGSLPNLTNTANTFVYTNALVVKGLLQLHAMAVSPGFGTSEVRQASYNLAYAERPKISPDGGFLTNGVLITLTCSTPGAAIYYSYALTTSSPERLYTGPFSIPTAAGSQTSVAAYSVAPGYAPSETSWTTFSAPRTATPVIDPPSSTTVPDQFTISCATPGATIYYTLDGNDPWFTSLVYKEPVHLTNSSAGVKAFAAAPGKERSEIAVAYYIQPQMQLPTFNPSWGPLTNGALISISNWFNPPGTVIRYTTDGSDPTETSPIYTASIRFTGPFTLKAIAEAPGYAPYQFAKNASVAYGETKYENTLVTTWAGSTNQGHVDGPRLQARFEGPAAICIDSNDNIYVADVSFVSGCVIRKISNDGVVTSIASIPNNSHRHLCIDDAGNLYITDTSTCNRIWKVTPTGSVTVFADLAECRPGYAPPFTIDAIAFGPDSSLYFAAGSFLQQPAIKKLTPDGVIVDVAPLPPNTWNVEIGFIVDASTNVFFKSGLSIVSAQPDGSTNLFVPGASVLSDGPRSTAGFSSFNLAQDASGNLIVNEGSRIRRVTADTITTIAGEFFQIGDPPYRNGPGATAHFSAVGVCVDSLGNIYLADSGNHCIRKISKDSAAIGIVDEWQLAHFGKIGIDPNGDDDGDGMSNYVEFWTGTNPQDASSFLTLDVTRDTAITAPIQIRWPTVAGKLYQVQFSRDLVEWIDYAEQILGDGSIATVTDATLPERNATWFYRVVIAE
jgi:hypothetical protein